MAPLDQERDSKIEWINNSIMMTPKDKNNFTKIGEMIKNPDFKPTDILEQKELMETINDSYLNLQEFMKAKTVQISIVTSPLEDNPELEGAGEIPS